MSALDHICRLEHTDWYTTPLVTVQQHSSSQSGGLALNAGEVLHDNYFGAGRNKERVIDMESLRLSETGANGPSPRAYGHKLHLYKSRV